MTQPDLDQRHRRASRTILVLLCVTAFLALIAYLGKGYFRQRSSSSIDGVVRITIFIFGLGAVALRRTRFTTMRLQDIGALSGAAGLLDTLQKTTLQLAVIAAVIAAIGFIATIATGNDFYTYGGGLVAIAVLLYAYPTKSSWQRAVRQFASAPESGT
ncbi:MAG TPA: hypothetical protein VJ023_10780 [Pyrinomonadaceae bacterium]|nr:hypothetical protein [Pyrinomonadaceae bacterium]